MSRRSIDALFAGVPRLTTARLLLRGWTEADVAPYARILADREVMAGLGSNRRYRSKRLLASAIASISPIEARVAIRRNLRHWQRQRHGLWAVEERSSGELAGYVGLLHHPDWTAEETQLEVGWLLRRSSWGKGLATEGGRASLEYAFGPLGAGRVVSITGSQNARSQRVMERLGMHFAGRTRWKRQSVVWYGLDAGEGPAPTPGLATDGRVHA